VKPVPVESLVGERTGSVKLDQTLVDDAPATIGLAAGAADGGLLPATDGYSLFIFTAVLALCGLVGARRG
ncbi:uncharacterized protein METZ01_LOCUS483288, partial [marine metagenome]